MYPRRSWTSGALKQDKWLIMLLKFRSRLVTPASRADAASVIVLKMPTTPGTGSAASAGWVRIAGASNVATKYLNRYGIVQSLQTCACKVLGA